MLMTSTGKRSEITASARPLANLWKKNVGIYQLLQPNYSKDQTSPDTPSHKTSPTTERTKTYENWTLDLQFLMLKKNEVYWPKEESDMNFND